MELSYLITPFLAWFVAGALKFLVNSIRAKMLAFTQIGYGGFPSNHSSIVASMVTLIALKEGISSPAFGAALTLAFVVMLDATSLRKQIGKQAVVLNHLASLSSCKVRLRERMGHTSVEIVAGTAVGVGVAIAMYLWGS